MGFDWEQILDADGDELADVYGTAVAEASIQCADDEVSE